MCETITALSPPALMASRNLAGMMIRPFGSML